MIKKMKRKNKIAIGASVLAMTAFGGVKAQALSVTDIANVAAPVADEYNLYPSVMIAQGILESANGTSGLANNYNNIFGVKATDSNKVNLLTQEYIDGKSVDVVQPFQVYDSLESSCVAQAKLLRSNFYSGVWRENTNSYQDATAYLQGRYATDPNYANKLNKIIAEYGLTAYDQGSSPAYMQADSAYQNGKMRLSTYKVKAGDNLSTIAAQYGISVNDIVAVNHILDINNIVEGTLLQIPGTETQSQSSTQTTSYKVQSGDTLTSIAAHYGVSVDALMSQNGLSNANNIVVGSSLQISSSQEATSPATQSTSYTVQSGDTLSSIASVYGTTISHIESMNGLSDGNSIYPGQTLNI